MLSLHGKQTRLMNNIFVSDSYKHKTLFKLLVVITITFPGGKVRLGRATDHSPLLVPRSWKSRSIPLPILWATPGL